MSTRPPFADRLALRGRKATASLLAGALALSGLARNARAQTTTLPVSVERYQPTPFANRFFQLEQGAPLPRGVFRVGLDLDYGARSLVVQDLSPRIDQAGKGRGSYDVVKGALGSNLLFSVGLGHHLEVGVALPLVAYQYGATVPGVAAPASAGLGNPRIGLKAGLLDRHGFELAASALVGLPSFSRNLVGSSDPSAELGISGGMHRGRWSLGLNLAAHLAKEREVFDRHVGSEWLAGAGVGWELSLRTHLLGEVLAATPLSELGRSHESPVESLLGLRHRQGRLLWTAGAGPGLVPGVGAPTFRALLGLAFASEVPDRDEDGIDDDHDRCLEEPEDRDGFADDDGCPDPDNDEDGILDTVDKCPQNAEDKDGFEDEDGCPDPDNDKDGILDTVDKCPDKPETKNGFQDDDGCPDEAPPPGDKDKDGILDEDDECPDEAEDKDGFEDEDGCPDPDNDKDGIPDAQDKCPLEPETINGVADEDGCPDKGQVEGRLGSNEIETLRPIYFDTDHSRVRHAFFPILGQIALVLKAHPEIGRCAVEGHTDDTGPPEWNQKLSALRASAVVEFLVSKGVDRQRLVAIGRGEQLPWASNDTPWGRARNRRVIFHIEGGDQEIKKRESTRQERRETIRHHKEQEPARGEGGEESLERTPPQDDAVTPSKGKTKHGRGALGEGREDVIEERTPPVDVLPSHEKRTPKKSERSLEGSHPATGVTPGDDGRPRDEKKTDEKKTDEKPGEKKPADEKPRHVKPRDAKTGDKTPGGKTARKPVEGDEETSLPARRPTLPPR